MAAIWQDTEHIAFFIISQTNRAAAQSGRGLATTIHGLGVKKLWEAPESGLVEAYFGSGDGNHRVSAGVGSEEAGWVVMRNWREAHAGDAVGSECYNYNQHKKADEHFNTRPKSPQPFHVSIGITSRGVHLLWLIGSLEKVRETSSW